MSRSMSQLACLVALMLSLVSCSSNTDEKNQVQPAKFHYKAQSVQEPLSKMDHSFIEALIKYIPSTRKVMDETELALEEAEQYDELHEILEVMEQAKQDILYYWNVIHNEHHPEHPELSQMKNFYEDILKRYQEGITLEIEGMEFGDVEKMKKGYQTTKTAVEDMRRLAEEWTDPR